MVPKRRCWTLFQHPSSTCSVPWKHPISTKSYTDPIAKVLNQRNANASKIKHGDDNFEQLNISIRNINYSTHCIINTSVIGYIKITLVGWLVWTAYITVPFLCILIYRIVNYIVFIYFTRFGYIYSTVYLCHLWFFFALLLLVRIDSSFQLPLCKLCLACFTIHFRIYLLGTQIY